MLFRTDGSDGALVAFDHVLDIATTRDATVHILNVVDTTQESVLQLRSDSVEVLEENGKKVVSKAVDRANQRGVDTITEVRQGEAYRTIIDYAGTTAHAGTPPGPAAVGELDC
ncbi:MAG: universal stress protein [Haloarculaceae archaeon]